MWKTIRPFVLVFVIGAVVIGGFFVVVGPLFVTGGTPQAEVNGLFDTQNLVAGKPAVLPVSVDNTGDATIKHLCLGLTFSAPVEVNSALFDNYDSESFSGGRVCGGQLVGQETIDVSLSVTAHAPGQSTVTITPLDGGTPVGKSLTATLSVTSH